MKKSAAGRGACRVAGRSAAACETNQDAGTVVGAVAGGIIGNQFGKGGGQVAATLAGAVVGGIVGNEIGRSLDERDRQLAREAEYDAWERGPPGRPRALAQSRQRPLRRDRRRGPLRARRLALPQLRAQGLDRRPPAGHARHRLPQPRRHLDPGRLRLRPSLATVALDFSRPGPTAGVVFILSRLYRKSLYIRRP